MSIVGFGATSFAQTVASFDAHPDFVASMVNPSPVDSDSGTSVYSGESQSAATDPGSADWSATDPGSINLAAWSFAVPAGENAGYETGFTETGHEEDLTRSKIDMTGPASIYGDSSHPPIANITTPEPDTVVLGLLSIFFLRCLFPRNVLASTRSR
jgi:hypothetical protein